MKLCLSSCSILCCFSIVFLLMLRLPFLQVVQLFYNPYYFGATHPWRLANAQTCGYPPNNTQSPPTIHHRKSKHPKNTLYWVYLLTEKMAKLKSSSCLRVFVAKSKSPSCLRGKIKIPSCLRVFVAKKSSCLNRLQ